MNTKLALFAAAFLPLCFSSAQQPEPQTPQRPNRLAPHLPSPETMRKIAEERQRMKEHSIAINDLAGHIQSIDDARKLINLVYAEFSDELPPKWATRSIRERIARAEYETAAEPGSLIPEQHVADAWNDFVQKIGAPQETMLNAAEIHYLRDGQYLTARIAWDGYEKDYWTIPGVFALGPDGRVANGSRALEAIRFLWLLGNNTEDFAAIHAQVQKGVLPTDQFLQWKNSQKESQTTSHVQGGGGFAVGVIVSFPIQQAAFHYTRDHGERAFNRAVEDLLKDLFAD